MENHDWSTVTSLPYIGSLLTNAQASYCTNYLDNPNNVHPSEPNYIWLEAGDNLGITTDDDPSPSHILTTTNHLVTQLAAKGVTWRAYAEGVTAGQCPLSTNGLYAPKHVPFVFFTDVVGNPPSASAPTCTSHVLPYSQLQGDLQNGRVGQYNFITPNLCDDMHNAGCDATADAWLKQQIPMIMASSAYTDDGAIFLTWDEGAGNSDGPIGMIVLSPLAKGNGYKSATRYYHSSTLRTVQEVFGVTPLLNDAANQPDLGDLFKSFP
jgi:hypothetical protein